MIFMPSFDIDQLRQSIGSKPLAAYEAIAMDVYHPELLVRTIREGWWRDGQLVTSLKAPISWTLPNRSHTYHLNAWEPISQLLAGFDRFKTKKYFNAAYSMVQEWLTAHQTEALSTSSYDELDKLVGRREDFVWYDMGVGLRCYRIAYILDVAARNPSVPASEIELLVRALYFHHEVLTRTKFFRFHNNHGIYQALGQLAAAKRFAGLPEMAEYQAMATRRLRRLLDNHVFRSGAHKEHSPGYHHQILHALIGARKADLLDDDGFLPVLGAMERALVWMIMPDFTLAPIGDTDTHSLENSNPSLIPYENPQLIYLMSNGKVGSSPEIGVCAYLDAGYVFARLPANEGQPPSEWSYLAQIAGFHSRAHKHADHLSFVWHDHGRLVLTDAGRYEYLGRTELGSDLAKDGFWYSNPKRVFIESTAAHNTIQIDGRNFQRIHQEPFGSAIVYAGNQSGLAVSECHAQYFESVRHRRVLIMSPGEFLLVLDSVRDRDGNPHDIVQRFNFAPAWDLEAGCDGWIARCADDVDGALTIRPLLQGCVAVPAVRGLEQDGLLAGWCAATPTTLVPATSVAYKQDQTSAALFATLFTYGREVAIVAEEQSCDVSLAEASFSWTVDGTSMKLAIMHSDTGLIAADLTRRDA